MTDSRSSNRGAPEVPVKVVVSTDGREWRVKEVPARDVPGAQGERCLIFDRGDVVRRLWRYPRHWHQLDAEALLNLPVLRE